MNYFIQVFYTYFLPLAALASFGYIIYLLLSKQSVFEYIEKDFEEAVEQNMKLSKSAIVEHFKEMQGRTAEMLEHLNQEAQEHLENSTQQVSKLQEQLEQVVSNQKALSSRLSELERNNAELHNEIKKRDAIIERKTKQVQRLKDAV